MNKTGTEPTFHVERGVLLKLDIPKHSHPDHARNTNTGTRTNLIHVLLRLLLVGMDPIPSSTLEVQPKGALEAPWEHLDGHGITAGIAAGIPGIRSTIPARSQHKDWEQKDAPALLTFPGILPQEGQLEV